MGNASTREEKKAPSRAFGVQRRTEYTETHKVQHLHTHLRRVKCPNNNAQAFIVDDARVYTEERWE
jgi:hypothetical protein